MRIIRTVKAMQAVANKLRCKGKRTGFVPTMGALHEGHLSLVRRCCRENDIAVASIFVNPMQFGPKEDFRKYPRTLARDRQLLRRESVDYLFLPSVREMYPAGEQTRVMVGGSLTQGLCGKFRPGHFKGVTTVVLKLFEAVRPDSVYFGMKDYQQGLVIRRLIRDLRLPIGFRFCPTIREADGLALSSRNQYLSENDRSRALAISRTLKWFRTELKRSGTRAPLANLRRRAKARLARTVDHIDYFEVMDAETLEPLSRRRPRMAVLTACFVGKTRLIDNVIIRA